MVVPWSVRGPSFQSHSDQQRYRAGQGRCVDRPGHCPAVSALEFEHSPVPQGPTVDPARLHVKDVCLLEYEAPALAEAVGGIRRHPGEGNPAIALRTIAFAIAVFVTKATSSPMPAWWQRSRSSVHDVGRYSRRSINVRPRPGVGEEDADLGALSRRAALSEDERLDVLGRLLTDAEIPMRLRAAGVIVLLYAQPVSRIVRLSVDDVIRDGDTVLLRLGEPASPVPAPVAALLLEHIANRDNMNTATNPASCWLFPGRRAGQPFRPDHLSALLNEVGVPAAAARGAAIRQQRLERPGPVVADALGYHDKTTSRLIRETGGTWSRYAPGDHARSPTGWLPRGASNS